MLTLTKIKDKIYQTIERKSGDFIISDVEGCRKYITLSYINRLFTIYEDVQTGISNYTKEVLLRSTFELVFKGCYIFNNKEYLKRKVIQEFKAINKIDTPKEITTDQRVLEGIKKLSKFSNSKERSYFGKYNFAYIAKRVSTPSILGRKMRQWYDWIYRINSPIVHNDFINSYLDLTKREYDTSRVIEMLIILYLNFLAKRYNIRSILKDLKAKADDSVAYAKSLTKVE